MVMSMENRTAKTPMPDQGGEHNAAAVDGKTYVREGRNEDIVVP